MYILSLPMNIEDRAITGRTILDLFIIVYGYEVHGISPPKEYGLQYCPYLLVAPIFRKNICRVIIPC